jgi:hypothetical protein
LSKDSRNSIIAAFAFALALVSLAPLSAAAGPEGAFEVSLGFNYSRSNYATAEAGPSVNYAWTRRWGTSLGYHFSERSSIEVGLQDSVDRTVITGYEDATFHDQVVSANWVQSLADKRWVLQPYVKLGAGQLTRDAKGSYNNGTQPLNTVLGALTVVAGGGFRIYLSRTLGIRTEATTYLDGGKVSTWKDNFGFQAGFSYYF